VPKVIDIFYHAKQNGLLLYYYGGEWRLLPPGERGQELISGGPDSYPLWAFPSSSSSSSSSSILSSSSSSSSSILSSSSSSSSSSVIPPIRAVDIREVQTAEQVAEYVAKFAKASIDYQFEAPLQLVDIPVNRDVLEGGAPGFADTGIRSGLGLRILHNVGDEYTKTPPVIDYQFEAPLQLVDIPVNRDVLEGGAPGFADTGIRSGLGLRVSYNPINDSEREKPVLDYQFEAPLQAG
jgi:hypothetical protein